MSILNQKNCGHLGLTFDDILLLPGYSQFWREEVDLTTKLTDNIELKLPVISSPMDTVTTDTMAITLATNGGLGVIHRSMPIPEQIAMIKQVKSTQGQANSAVDSKGFLLVAGAVGVGPDFTERVVALAQAGADMLVVDTAHGHTKFIIDSVRKIKELVPTMPVMAGNITTTEGALALIEAGADVLRVGMGPGSICTTRIVTGMGVPQLTAISLVKEGIIQSGKNVKLIADGGIKQLGDIAKALAFGADAVMLGSLLAGYKESPGSVVEVNDSQFKTYRGMGSAKAMSEGSAARYGQAGIEQSKLVSEGVEGLVKYKGEVTNFLFQISGALKSSFYYIGGINLQEFQSKAKFVQITSASWAESMPHSITITETGNSFVKK
jgi:IMP dehydrogenase